jgi:serine protease AprX
MRITRFFMFFVFISMLIAPTGSVIRSDFTPKIQPRLLQAAVENPEQLVAVVVQKQGETNRVEEQAAKLGGKVTQALSIINAFAAEMPAQAAVELSRMEAVRWVSLDAKVTSSACSQCVDTANLASSYIYTIKADKAWNSSPYLQGMNVGIAIVDSGINPSGDLYTNMGANRQVANVRFNTDYNQNTSDGYGHGTHVSSVAAGDGSDSNGKYIGVAPLANVINVKVTNDDGSARSSDVIAGLQWILENKATYKYRL